MSLTNQIDRSSVLENAVNQFKQLAKNTERSLSSISPVTIKLTQPKLRKSSSRYYDFLFYGTYEITSQITNKQFIIKIKAHTECKEIHKLYRWANQWCLDHAKKYLSNLHDNLFSAGTNLETFYRNLQINYIQHNPDYLKGEQNLPDTPEVLNACNKLYLACQKSMKTNKPMSASFTGIWNQPSEVISWAEPSG